MFLSKNIIYPSIDVRTEISFCDFLEYEVYDNFTTLHCRICQKECFPEIWKKHGQELPAE